MLLGHASVTDASVKQLLQPVRPVHRAFAPPLLVRLKVVDCNTLAVRTLLSSLQISSMPLVHPRLWRQSDCLFALLRRLKYVVACCLCTPLALAPKDARKCMHGTQHPCKACGPFALLVVFAQTDVASRAVAHIGLSRP
jgi:hypothetical protein